MHIKTEILFSGRKTLDKKKNAFEFARKRRCLTSAFFTKTLFFCEHIFTAEKSVKKIRKVSFRMKNCAAKNTFAVPQKLISVQIR